MKRSIARATAAVAAGLLAAAVLRAGSASAPARRAAQGQEKLPAHARMRFGQARLHHGASIEGLAFSPDGKLLASYGGQYNLPGEIALWDVATGRLIRSLTGPNQQVQVAGFLADGKTLVAAGTNLAVCFWDVASGQSKSPSGLPRGRWLDVSPDGRLLAVGSDTGVSVLEAASGKRLHEVKKHTFCAFSPDGRLLAVTSMRSSPAGAELWDPATGKLVRELVSKNQRFTAPVFSPDGKLLAASCMYGAERGVMLWETATGKIFRKLSGQGNYVYRLAFSRDGRLLATACRTAGVQLWQVETGKLDRELPAAGDRIAAVAFCPDGKLLAAGGYSGQVRLWQTDEWRERYSEAAHRGAVADVAASRDAARVVTGGQDGTARVWDGRSGRQLHRLAAGEAASVAVAISPDGRLLATCAGDGTVRLWDAAGGGQRHCVKVAPGAGAQVVFPPPGQEVLSFGPSGAVSVIDARTGVARTLQPAGKSNAARAAVSGDARVAVSFDRGAISAWQLRTGRRLGVFGVGGMAYFYDVAVDPTARLLAGDVGAKIVLIELDSGGSVREISVPSRRVVVRRAAFSPDGTILATGESDGEIGLWSVRTGEKLGERGGQRGGITSLAFLADGKGVLSGGADGTAVLWDLAGIKAPVGSDPADATKLEECWSDLASNDAGKAHEAIFRLIDAGKSGAAFLSRRLGAVEGPPQELHQWIADLGHHRFGVRKQATAELARLGPLAEPALRRALAESQSEEVRARAQQLLAALDEPHQRSGQALRQLRAVHVLERIGSQEAKAVLRKLAGGSPSATATQRAAAALDRLGLAGK